MEYLRVVRAYVESCSPGESILDVGCGGTDVVCFGDFQHRCAINKQPLSVQSYEGVSLIIGDWLQIALPRPRYTVVTCCQVIEHQVDSVVDQFARKLLSVAETLIISAPYLWPANACRHHHQDPVSVRKLAGWFGNPATYEIVHDGKLRRIVAMFQQGETNG